VGATFTTRDLTADGQWHELVWNFPQVNDSASLIFIFTVKEGEGTVFFDDIIAVEKK
jgi:hypothetical protein